MIEKVLLRKESELMVSDESMQIRVAYDLSYLATFFERFDCKTGVFRVIEETLYELSKRKDVELTGVALCGRFQLDENPFLDAAQSFLYLEDRKNVLDCKFDPSFKNRLGLSKSYWAAFGHLDVRQDLKQIVDLESGLEWRPQLQDRQKRSLRSLHLRALRSILYRLNYGYKIDRLTKEFNPKKFDLFHSGFSKLPSVELTQSVPRVLTVYDLIPVRAPEFVDSRFLAPFREILASIDIRRDWIACISEYTKQEFCEYMRMSTNRVFVTPLAAADYFYPVSDCAVIGSARSRYGIPEGSYFLSLATPQPRKNLTHLIRCFFRLLSDQPTKDVNLVLVGSSKQAFKLEEILSTIKGSAEFSSKVIFTDYIPDEDLSAIYSGATAFIFPSLYEGFGLPVLEAMQCGTPAIASNTTSVPEVVGDAGIMIDPTDSDQLCQAMLDVLTDASLQERLKREGLKRAQEFSWQKCAGQLVDLYKQAINSQ
jgi:glycosyltransferase involved in cell wall biosynthesis